MNTTIARVKSFKRLEDGTDIITGEEPVAFYHLPDGCATYADVPIGSQFTAVYISDWSTVTLEVILSQIKNVDKKPCRYYRQKAKRMLESDEIAGYKALLEREARGNV